jgi:PmbA protein
LLVTELMGQGVNRVTGDYSRGASGYWIKNGVTGIPCTSDHRRQSQSMYQNIVAIGSDVDVRGGVRVGAC